LGFFIKHSFARCLFYCFIQMPSNSLGNNDQLFISNSLSHVHLGHRSVNGNRGITSQSRQRMPLHGLRVSLKSFGEIIYPPTTMKKSITITAVIVCLSCTSCTSQSRQESTQNEQARFDQKEKRYPDRLSSEREKQQAETGRRQEMLGNR